MTHGSVSFNCVCAGAGRKTLIQAETEPPSVIDDETDRDDDRFDGFVGDGREKYVTAHTNDGELLEYGETYVKHAADAYVISSDPDFPPGETERLSKADLTRVEIDQHHSTCFITTAAGTERDLETLRGFRDDAMSASWSGRVLLAVYERLSPPIARTLASRPTAKTTRVVRWLVSQCAWLARRREATGVGQPLVSLLLVVLYVLGVVCAVAGHTAIRTRQLKKRSMLSRN